MQTKRKGNKTIKELLFYASIAILVLLSYNNLVTYYSPKKILGVTTETNLNPDKENFWQNFLKTHPDYIPGWLEINKTEEAMKIDPNYIIP